MSGLGYVSSFRSQRVPARLTAALLVAHVALRLALELIPDDGSLSTAIAVLAFLAVKVATPIAFLVWLAGVYRNLPALGSRTKRTAAWAVGFWFVPVVNLWHGYAALKLAWLESQPEPGHRHAPLVAWWWGLFLLSFLRLVFGGVDMLALARTSVEILAAGLGAIVVVEIDARQREQHADLVEARTTPWPSPSLPPWSPPPGARQ